MATDRLARGDQLMRLLEAQGCTHAVRLGETPAAGGLGVFATRDLKAGDVVMRCPTSALLRPSDVDADVTLASAIAELSRRSGLQIDERQRLQLLLLHERHRLGAGQPTVWGAYIESLPARELVDALPLSWSPADLERRARGTALFSEVPEARSGLSALEREVRRNAPLFGGSAGAFSMEGLEWAHAVFWSRALVLDLPGRTECLVPLLDLCNHRAGATTELRVAAGCFELRAGRSLRCGDEVLINYGAKGNAELLRCHGFVLPDNQADVCPLELSRLALAAGQTEELCRREHEARLGLLRELRLADRPFLFHGGLPERLLPAARLLCAPTAADLRAAREALDGTAAGSLEEAAPFDWNSVDWTQDDPFEGCDEDDDSPLSAVGERATTEALVSLLSQSRDAIAEPSAEEERQLTEACASASGGVKSGGGGADLAALVYRSGQRALLEEARSRLQRRLDRLLIGGRKREGAAVEHGGEKASRPAACR